MASPFVPPPSPGPATMPPMPPGPPQGRRVSIGLVALIALVVLCGVAGVVLALMNFGEKPQTEEAEASEGPTRIAAVPVGDGSVQPRAQPLIEPLVIDELDQVAVKIETTPPGAEVFRAGESVGLTPIEGQFERGGSEVWQIFLDDYEVEELTVTLDADFHSAIVLTRVAPEPAKPAAASADTSTGSGSKSASSNGSSSSRKKDDDKKKKDKPKDSGGRTVIKSTTGATLPD